MKVELVKQDPIVRLELSYEEAQIVKELCLSVCGPGYEAIIAHDISQALHNAGVELSNPYRFTGSVTAVNND